MMAKIEFTLSNQKHPRIVSYNVGNPKSEIISPIFHTCLHELVFLLCRHMRTAPIVARQQDAFGGV